MPFVGILPTEELTGCRIKIDVLYAAAGVSIYFQDLVLMPVDEWAGTFDAGVTTTSAQLQASWLGANRYVDMDSIRNPRRFIRGMLNTIAGAVGDYRCITNGPAVLQSGRSQRLWFFTTRHTATTNEQSSDPEEAGRVQTFRQQRYFSMRGSA